MDLRTRTTMLCAAFAIAITISILLRSRKRKVHYLLSAFAGTMALWYLAQWLFMFFQAAVWWRFTAVLAVILPQLALHLFEAIAPHPPGHKSRLLRVGTGLGAVMLVLAVSNYQQLGIVRGLIFVYVFGLVAAGLASLAAQGRSSPSRAVKERVRLLVIVGSFALALSIADFTWFIGADLPPVGAVLSVVFLFALAESMQRERLVDLYEMIGRLVVFTALAFCLAGIFYAFIALMGVETMYLNAVLAAIAILLLFEPLRAKVEEQIHGIFFRQRRELESAVDQAKQRLVHALELEDVADTVVTTLSNSRRVTAVALYLLDSEGHEFTLRNSFGQGFSGRMEVATCRPLMETLGRSASVVLDDAARQVGDARLRGAPSTGPEAVLASGRLFGSLAASGVILGIRSKNEEVIGLLFVQDERVADAFSPEEVVLLEGLAALVSVVVENSWAYARMKDRDRLAALGQMAAGLAHEIKNPLGSIKGAAQLLADTQTPPDEASTRDFLDIIIEEADRLDRVVRSVLDYARPRGGDPVPVDANAIVRRTVHILAPAGIGQVSTELVLDEALPMVRVDAEQLRQVLMNLIQNALQAMGERGALTIITRERASSPSGWSDVAHGSRWIEIVVRDTGPGIPHKNLSSLFVPFFSTKTRGTGLGLAISQRIVQSAGGALEVSSQVGEGSSFTIVLPATAPTDAVESDPTAGASLPRALKV